MLSEYNKYKCLIASIIYTSHGNNSGNIQNYDTWREAKIGSKIECKILEKIGYAIHLYN